MFLLRAVLPLEFNILLLYHINFIDINLHSVMSYLHDIKTICMQSEVKRVHYEARMQTQFDLFTKKMTLLQGQSNDGRDDQDEYESFEDLDENFPIDYEPHVTELEWNIQKDLTMKRRLVIMLSVKC